MTQIREGSERPRNDPRAGRPTRAPAPPGSGPIVVYIGGSGRSGSTLLECLLAELDDVVVLGEVAHLWSRGIRLDELCACGEPFGECPFWSAVGESAFGGWSAVDVDEVLALKDLVDRQRRMPQTARRRTPPGLRDALHRYADHYHRIYRAAAEVSGARIVVDSSKVAPTALGLSHHPGIDLRVLHIVRDSRGVAYSWSKVVRRPETGDRQEMPRLSARASTALWLSHNLSMAALSHRGVPLHRIRYEDLVEDAAATVASAWRSLDLPGPGRLPMLDRASIELHATHSVAGNPMRFRTGTTTLRPDLAWVESMPAHERRWVTLLSWPALRAYGYHAAG